MPLVSILLATRDDLATLPKAVGPFLASPLDLEIVIVDDGSRPDTAAYLDGLPRERVRVIRLAESGGLTRALNLAFKASRGEFLARQDADDVSRPGRLEAQLEAFRADAELGILGTGHRVVDEAGAVLAELKGRNFGRPAKRLARGNYFCHGSLMLRRSALERLGGYREFFRFAQDYDLMLRAAGLGIRIANLEACLYDWTFSTRAISARKGREQARYARVAREAFADAGLDLDARFRELEASEERDPEAARPIPPEWQLMQVMLLAGDTGGARRQYEALIGRGGEPPAGGWIAGLRLLPPWLYRTLRGVADLRYR